MKKLPALLVASIAFIFIACDSKPTEESDSSEITEAIILEKTAICMWHNLSLRAEPKGDGKYLTAASMGERMIYLDSTVTDETSKKKYQYAHVQLSDDTQGWMRNDLIVIDAELAVITSKVAICKRADLITKTDKSFETMDIIAVQKLENGWAHVKGIIKGGTWYSEGWVQESMLSYRTSDITDAILTSKALIIKDDKEKLDELKRIYELEYEEGYSEFRPVINSLIGELSNLEPWVYEVYECFLAHLEEYDYKDGSETVTILGRQFDQYDYSIFGPRYSFANCVSRNYELKDVYKIYEAMSGIPVLSNDSEDNAFDYINPVFIKWVRTHMIPRPEDDFLKTNLSAVYKVIIREQFRKLDMAYRMVENNYPSLTDDYRRNVVENGKRALPFLETYMEDSYEYVDSWGIGFWARRDIDGSKDEVHELLTDILMAYDEQYLIDNQ